MIDIRRMCSGLQWFAASHWCGRYGLCVAEKHQSKFARLAGSVLSLGPVIRTMIIGDNKKAKQ